VTSESEVDLSGRVAQLLDSGALVHVSTVGKDGNPQASVVWVERRENEVVFFSRPESQKVRNLLRDPRIVLLIIDTERAYAPGVPAYVRLTGLARIQNPGDSAFPHRLTRRYMGLIRYPWPLKAHVDVHVTILSINGLGLP
jgi:PPOX class probable F420-dependent enzyme